MGEPVVSQHCDAACFQWSYVGCDGLLVTSGEMEWKANSGVDDRVCGAIKKLEGERIDLVGVELMFENGGGVQETVS